MKEDVCAVRRASRSDAFRMTRLGRSHGFVSLWDVRTLVSGGVAFGNSWVAVTVLGASGANRVWALIFGAFVAVGCVWFIRRVGDALFRILDRKFPGRDDDSKRKLEWGLRAVYVGGLLWLIGAGVVGFQATALFIKCCLS